MKRLNETESSIFVILCDLCFQRQSISTYILLFFQKWITLTLCCFVVYFTRRFVLSLALCYFVLVLFRPFSIATTSLGEERAYLSAFRTFIRFALVWFCLFPLSLGAWKWLRLVLHMKRLNQTESPIRNCVCSLFPKAILFDLYCDCGTPWAFFLPFLVCRKSTTKSYFFWKRVLSF